MRAGVALLVAFVVLSVVQATPLAFVLGMMAAVGGGGAVMALLVYGPHLALTAAVAAFAIAGLRNRAYRPLLLIPLSYGLLLFVAAQTSMKDFRKLEQDVIAENERLIQSNDFSRYDYVTDNAMSLVAKFDHNIAYKKIFHQYHAVEFISATKCDPINIEAKLASGAKVSNHQPCIIEYPKDPEQPILTIDNYSEKVSGSFLDGYLTSWGFTAFGQTRQRVRYGSVDVLSWYPPLFFFMPKPTDKKELAIVARGRDFSLLARALRLTPRMVPADKRPATYIDPVYDTEHTNRRARLQAAIDDRETLNADDTAFWFLSGETLNDFSHAMVRRLIDNPIERQFSDPNLAAFRFLLATIPDKFMIELVNATTYGIKLTVEECGWRWKKVITGKDMEDCAKRMEQKRLDGTR